MYSKIVLLSLFLTAYKSNLKLCHHTYILPGYACNTKQFWSPFVSQSIKVIINTATIPTLSQGIHIMQNSYALPFLTAYKSNLKHSHHTYILWGYTCNPKHFCPLCLSQPIKVIQNIAKPHMLTPNPPQSNITHPIILWIQVPWIIHFTF